jgi:hypothetical protein
MLGDDNQRKVKGMLAGDYRNVGLGVYDVHALS